MINILENYIKKLAVLSILMCFMNISSAQQMHKVNLNIQGEIFNLELESNDTTEALLKHLPLEMELADLHANEKYEYLPFSLPTTSYEPITIEEGDVLLFNDNCFVIFYKTFKNPGYSYSKIGKVEDTKRLKQVVGQKNIKVIVSKD